MNRELGKLGVTYFRPCSLTPLEDRILLAGHEPALTYWPAEVERLQVLAADDTVGTLGVSSKSIADALRTAGEAKVFDSSLLPAEVPPDRKDAESVAAYAWQGVQWAGYMHHVVGDSRFVDFAVDTLDTLISWDEWIRPEWSNSDIVLSDFVRAATFTLDWFSEELSINQESLGLASLISKGVSLYEEYDAARDDVFREGSPPNHMMSSATAWGNAAMVIDSYGLETHDWLDRSLFYYREALSGAAAGGADGGAAEGLHYSLLTFEFMKEFDLNVEHHAGIDILEFSENDWSREHANYVAQMTGPGGLTVNFNDSDYNEVPSFRAFQASLMMASQFDGTPESELAQGLASVFADAGLRTPSGLRYVDNSITAADRGDQPLNAYFESVGQAVVRTGWEPSAMQFAFKSQPASPDGGESHRQFDAGNVVLNWGGDFLLSDPGVAVKSFHLQGLNSRSLERFGCGDSELGQDELVSLVEFTLGSPGHNTVTLQLPDGSRILQNSFDVEVNRADLETDGFFLETDFSDAYIASGEVTPALDFGGRRIVGSLPDALLIHDRIESTTSTGPVHARFHLHSRNVDASLDAPIDEQIVQVSPVSALLSNEGTRRRLRIHAQGPSVSVAPDSDIDCLGEYLAVTNESPEEAVDLFTLILPETANASSPDITPVESADSVGYEISIGEKLISIYVARFGSTFDPGDGSAAIARVAVTDGTGTKEFISRVDGAAPTFVDVTAQADLPTRDFVTRGSPQWADFDNDGDVDVFVSRHQTGYSMYRNDGDGTFTPTAPFLFETPQNFDLHAGAWGDFNNDGWVDLYIAYGGGGGPPPDGVVGIKNDQLYINNGDGTFDEISSSAGVTNQFGRDRSASLVDIDNDGLLDIYAMNFVAPKRFFYNNGDLAFNDVAPVLGLEDVESEQFPFGVLGHQGAWTDYDLDGDLDAFLFGSKTSLRRNDGVGALQDVTADAGLITAGARGAAWGDYNNDGHIDLFYTNRTSKGGNKLFVNNGDATFTNVTQTSGLDVGDAPIDSWGTAWGDYDNDGDLDLYVVNTGLGDFEPDDPGLRESIFDLDEHDDRLGRIDIGPDENDPDLLYRNNGDGTFTDVSQSEGITAVRAGLGEGVSWADYDNDGFLDIMVTNGKHVGSTYPKGGDILYRNSGNENHWLKIVPKGTVSNRSALGLKVTLTANGKPQFREHVSSGGGGIYSQGVGTPIHFGLGDATVVESLILTWPSGIVEEFNNIPVDQMVELVEATGRITAFPALSPMVDTEAAANPLDVDRDGYVSAADALAVTSFLNGDLAVENAFDTNRDGSITPLDVLQIINFLGQADSAFDSVHAAPGAWDMALIAPTSSDAKDLPLDALASILDDDESKPLS